MSVTKKQVIQAGRAMHEARAKQAVADSKVASAQEKVTEIINRSKSGRAAQESLNLALEERKTENKNTKAQETRLKNVALEYAEQRLQTNPEDRLKDFHYAITATPITVYEPARDVDGLAMFIAYLFENELTHLIKFEGDVEVFVDDGESKSYDLGKWLELMDARGQRPPGVDKKMSARLTVSGYEKWEEKQSHMMTDLDELQMIQGILQDTE